MGDYLQAILVGLGNVASPSGFLIIVAGTLLAMLMSFLPGIGTASLLTLVMLLTLSWSQTSVLLLFGALVGGATFMGSVTAILFNVPGSAPNAATLIDGYPLSKRGFTKTAIAAAATASAIGSVLGVLVLLAALPFLSRLVPSLGPWEQLLLGIWGLTTIVALPSSSRSKAALMCLLGLLAAMIGNDPIAAQPRWHFGIDGLVSGLGIVPVLLGFFTFAEIISWGESQVNRDSSFESDPQDSTAAGIRAVLARPLLTLKSSLIGTLIGIIPGVGGTVAGFVAYGQAQGSESEGSQFGQGDIRGVIAPEAATDAKDGGSLVPAIALGLPGSEVGVFLIAVLAIHGLVPGEPMLNAQLSLTMTLILALLVSNLLTSALGIGLAPRLEKLGRIPLQRAILPILVLSFLLIVQLNGLLIDVLAAVVFGVFGYVCKRLDWPRVPLVIAFVLGEFIERNLALSGRLIELGRVEPLQRPVAITIIVLIFASLLLVRRRNEKRVLQWQTEDVCIGGASLLLCTTLLITALMNNYSGYGLAVSTAGSLFSIVFLIVAVRNSRDSSANKLVPAISALPRNLLAFACFPVCAWLVGFELALGLMVFAILISNGDEGRKRAVIALAWSFAVMIFSMLMIREVWQIELNDAVLIGLLF